ncbi:MAG TPA: AmmeMemoRadiSam system protein B [Syntrophales bacterium]|nr:AmmeMemoRadiSam system protein B [Syntrophales bacterium]
MEKDIRKSIIAGTWYPDNPKTLRTEIENFFHNVPDKKIDGKIIGLVVPHAGYVYSGQIAAFAYKIIRGETFDAVIVLGPSHRAFFHGVSIYDRGGYETPLGVVPVDVSLAKDILAQSKMIANIPAAHSQEHSLEIQLPFLQVALGEFRFVPLVMGEQNRQTCETLAESIFRAIGDRKVLIVGSSDLSHFHSYEKAVKLDNVVLKHIEKLDGRGLIKDMENNICEACGGGPAAVTMMVSEKLGADRAKILKYANSGDVTGDRGSVVGYASAVFYKARNP